MRIRIFRARTLAAAMAQIRAELGADALILSDHSRDGFVEVTAALETNEPPDLRTPVRRNLGPDDLEPFPAAMSERRSPSADRVHAHTAPPPRGSPGTLDASLIWHGLSPSLASVLSIGPIQQNCAAVFRFSPLTAAPDGKPALLAGPPGGGKTLTIARLATRMVLARQSPMVITADGKRAGAIEQLAAFTRLLGLTLIAANTPAMLARALERRDRGQPVLIDAPGLDLTDAAQSELLVALISAAGATMSLVLPCGLDATEAQEIACAHAGLGAETLVATRTDPSRRLGSILHASLAAQLPLSEAGIGSAAAESLVPFTPAFLAERLQSSGATGPSAVPWRPGTVAGSHATETPTSVPGRLTQRATLALHAAAQRRASSSL